MARQLLGVLKLILDVLVELIHHLCRIHLVKRLDQYMGHLRVELFFLVLLEVRLCILLVHQYDFQ